MSPTNAADIRALSERVVEAVSNPSDICAIFMALRIYATILDHQGPKAAEVVDDFDRRFPGFRVAAGIPVKEA